MSTLRVNNITDLGGTVPSYRYVTTLYYTSSDTFVKADYPWLNGIRVKAQAGGGGAGGAAATSSTESSQGKPGGGGGYAEKFISDISSLANSENILVGAGGSGGSSPNGGGSDGGNSSFGEYCIATGGEGGSTSFSTNYARSYQIPGLGGYGTAGDLFIRGKSGTQGGTLVAGGSRAMTMSNGGDSHLGAGALPQDPPLSNSFINGRNATSWGGGGSPGGSVGSAAGAAGGSGANGIVILELYA